MGTTPDLLRLLPVTSLSAAALPCASLSTEATPLDGKEMEPLYVVPWRPPMMTFRAATSEGQSDDTQVKGRGSERGRLTSRTVSSGTVCGSPTWRPEPPRGAAQSTGPGHRLLEGRRSETPESASENLLGGGNKIQSLF